MRHVNANLMRAPRLDLYFQQRELGVAFGGFKDRMRRAARAAAQHRHARAMVRAAAQPRFDLALLLRHTTVDQRHVQLEDFTIAELLGQPFMRHIIFSDDQQGRGLFIDAMYDAGPYAPSGSRQLIEVIDQRIRQRPRFLPCAGVNHQPRRLVHHNQIIIFINDVEGNRFGL